MIMQRERGAGLGLHPEARAPLAVLVSRQLRQAIVSGRVGSGAELPSEKELGEELGVGRSTVREALRILQAQGLVTGGDRVSTRRPRVSSAQGLTGAAALAMENALRLGQVPLRDLVELRVVVEGAAARAASERKGAVAAARAAVRAMRDASGDVDAFRAADLAFHRALADASGNAAFPLVMGVLRTAIAGHLGEALLAERDPQKTMRRLVKEHEAILAAVEGGRALRAERLVAAHVRDFYEARTAR